MANSSVAGDTHCALLHLDASGCEVTIDEGSIDSADMTVVDFAEDLTECEVWEVDVSDLAFGGVACVLPDAGFLVS